MAAPSSTVWSKMYSTKQWYEFKIGVYISVSSTNTTTTATTEVWMASNYAIDDGDINVFYRYGSGVTSITADDNYKVSSTADFIGPDNTGNWKNQIKVYSKTLTYNRTTSAQKIGVYAAAGGIYNYSTSAGGLINVGTTFTVPALPSYTITYKANGGTGSDYTGTKWYNTTLTLPTSTTFTRSGYTFVGWATSPSSTTKVTTCTTNSTNTYYAIWKKDIKLSYDANGGSGAPSSSTQTVYNATTSYKFTISSTEPTRTGHKFLGWSTSSTATSASYLASGNITISSNTTLYAVWRKNKLTLYYNTNLAGVTVGTYTGATTGYQATATNVYTGTFNYGGGPFTDGLHDIPLTATGYTHTNYWKCGSTLVKRDATVSTSTLCSYVGKDINSGDAEDTIYAQWEANEYTNTINHYKETGTKSDGSIERTHQTTTTFKGTYNSSVSIPTSHDQSYTGYTCHSTAGGFWGTDTWSRKTIGSTFQQPAQAVTIEYYYDRNTYTIRFDGNGNTSGSTSTLSMTYDVEKSLPSNGFVKTGYTFSNWNTKADGKGTSYSAGGSVNNLTSTNNDTVTLYAQWTTNTVNISYRANGGSVSASGYSTNDNGVILQNGKDSFQSLYYGVSTDPYDASTFELSKTGYTFYKWSVRGSGEELSQSTAYASTVYTQYDDSSKSTVNTNGVYCVLDAMWTPNIYKVTLDNQGATTAGTTEYWYKYNTSNYYSDSSCSTQMSNRITIPVKSGYTFKGYYSGKNGAGTQFVNEAGAHTNNLYKSSSENITLYAKWTPNIYKVTLNNQSATTAGDSCYYYMYNTTQTINGTKVYYYSDSSCETPFTRKINTPTKTGYTFEGYYSQVDGKQYIEADGTRINSIYSSFDSNPTLYARWTANKYTVTFDPCEGTSNTATKTVTYDSTYGTLPTPERMGYKFTGWYTAKSGGTKVTSDTSVKITENQTLYAHWDTQFITINYHDSEFNIVKTEMAYFLEDYKVPATTIATRPNHKKSSGYWVCGNGTTIKENSTLTGAELHSMFNNSIYDALVLNLQVKWEDLNGFVYISDGSTYKKAKPWIYTEKGWKDCFTWMHNGSKWIENQVE